MRLRTLTATLSLSLSLALVGSATNAGWAAAPVRAPSVVSASAVVRAFDSTATITDPAWFASMKARGFGLYVLHSTSWGTCDPWWRAQVQAQMALKAGLRIAAYTRDPRCWRTGITALGPYASQLQFFALDVETDPGVPVTREMVDGVRALGVRPVIYSGSGMWPQVMGGSTAFSDVPLWDANAVYGTTLSSWKPSMKSPAAQPYGGWNTGAGTARVGLQQRFEVKVQGVPVDLNTFAASFLR
ncbi:MAG TPA: hypothetical protein VES02_05530 [Dermatophilaceae bacterium]|nr:hypothetical protein [Dermatophilaceae bacterium]